MGLIRKFLIILGTLVLFAGFTFGITACGKTPTEEKPEEPTTTIPVEKITEVVNKIKENNYSYLIKTSSGESLFQFDENKCIITENGEKSYISNRRIYNFVEGKNGEIYKFDVGGFILGDPIYETLEYASFDKYENNKFYGTTIWNQSIVVELADTEVNIEWPNSDQITKIFDIGTTEVEIPEGIAVSQRVSTFLNSLGSNYSVEETKASGVYRYLLENGDEKCQYFAPNQKTGVIQYVEDGKIYSFSYDEQAKTWIKTEQDSLAVHPSKIINENLNKIQWLTYEYDGLKEIVNGQKENGERVEFVIEDDKATLTYANGEKISIGDYGKVEVEIPKIQEEKIFTVDANGEYHFNVALMAKTIEEFNKETDFYAKLFLIQNFERTLEKVICINPTATTFNIVLFTTNDKQKGFHILDNRDGSWAKFVAEGNGSLEAFKNYLHSNNKIFEVKSTPQTPYEYSMFDCSDEQRQNFEIMTKNIFNMWAELGQRKHVKEDVYKDKLPEMKDAEVIFWWKTEQGRTAAGGGLGYGQEWKNWYILKFTDGHYEMLKTSTFSTIDNVPQSNPEYAVLNNLTDKFVSCIMERYEIVAENGELYAKENVPIKAVNCRNNPQFMYLIKADYEQTALNRSFPYLSEYLPTVIY